jgi:hypothetical protein
MTLRSAWLGSLLAVLLAAPSGAAQRILDDVSDFYATGTGGVGTSYGTGQAAAFAGDTADGSGNRVLVRFPVADLALPQPPTRLELTLVYTLRQEIPETGLDSVPPFTNPGLGDLRIQPVPDYANPFSDDYQTASLADPIVLVPAGEEGPQPLSADVTAAVQAERELGEPVATFRIETAVESDGNGHDDYWYIATSEAGPDQSPALVVPEPDVALCGSAALAAFAATRRRR